MLHQEPIHVLYGGAHLFQPGLLDKLNRLSLKAFDRLGPTDPDLRQRIAQRLHSGSIQDLRIDFEDGFGLRSPSEEDATAKSAGKLAADVGNLPQYWGIRIRSLAPKLQDRALRTLELFTNEANAVPPVITIPKIQSPAEVDLLVTWLQRRGLPSHLELMVETANAVRDLPALIQACQGRCDSLHFGAYDFLSELGVPAPGQSLRHPFCDQARLAMQMAVAGTDIRVVDGVTSLLPVDPAPQPGWDLHIANIRHSLAQGFFSSWDVHPAQVAARYVALFSYYDEHQAALAARLRKFLDDQAQATRAGAAFDDAATVRGLVRFFLCGRDCGAITPEELTALTGANRDALLLHL